MHENKRKTRYFKLLRKAGLCSFACISLVSCSLFSTTNKNAKASKEKVHTLLQDGICGEFSGRGRIKLGKRNDRFTYTSILDDQNFKLGINIPFKGQETLILPLGKSKLSGTLYEKIRVELLAQRKEKLIALVDSFLMQSIALFDDIVNVEKGQCNRDCLPGRFSVTEDEKVSYTVAMGNSYLYRAIFDNLQSDGYRVISFQGLKATEDPKKFKRVMALDLLVDSCE